MSTLAEVRLWGRTIGAVALADEDDVASFEYAEEFARSAIQVAPLTMPLSRQVHRFPQLSRETFHGLPGLLADSLPDKFGHALIDAWLARQGRAPESMNAVERLCYVGTRGMGALEFRPTMGPGQRSSQAVHVGELVALASQVLRERASLDASLAEGEEATALRDILRVGTSAGGARAKAILAWNPSTNEVRSGQADQEAGFEPWILKFDGVSENRDKELADPRGYGAVEFAYSNMAKAAGITMPECRLLEENGRRHFMARRFDREADGGKLHMQSLGAIAHFDFNLAGGYSYEQMLQVARDLDLGMTAFEEIYRRMLFNVIARNQDDHVKNFAFLMDKGGRWSLSPAFDLTFAYNPRGAWTARHQLSLNGKRDEFEFADLAAVAKSAGLKRGRDRIIAEEVTEACLQWMGLAADAGVDESWATRIDGLLRTQMVD